MRRQALGLQGLLPGAYRWVDGWALQLCWQGLPWGAQGWAGARAVLCMADATAGISGVCWRQTQPAQGPPSAVLFHMPRRDGCLPRTPPTLP